LRGAAITIFMILPQPDAHPDDRGLPVSTLDELVTAYRAGYTVDSFPGAVERRGHYWRFTLRLMEDLIQWCNDFLDLDWQLVETEAQDRKVGNGWTLIAQWKPSRSIPSGDFVGESIVDTIMRGEMGTLVMDEAVPGSDQRVIVEVSSDHRGAIEAAISHDKLGEPAPETVVPVKAKRSRKKPNA